MSKGLRQTSGPQIVVRPSLRIGDIVIAGYLKNVTLADADGEAALSVGMQRTLAGFDLSATVAARVNTGASAARDSRALETAMTVGRAIGPIRARFTAVWSPDDLGSTRNSLLLEAGAALRLHGPLSIDGAIARRTRRGGPDYIAYNAGLTLSVAHNLSAELRWYDTDRAIDATYRSRLVLAGRLRF